MGEGICLSPECGAEIRQVPAASRSTPSWHDMRGEAAHPGPLAASVGLSREPRKRLPTEEAYKRPGTFHVLRSATINQNI